VGNYVRGVEVLRSTIVNWAQDWRLYLFFSYSGPGVIGFGMIITWSLFSYPPIMLHYWLHSHGKTLFCNSGRIGFALPPYATEECGLVWTKFNSEAMTHPHKGGRSEIHISLKERSINTKLKRKSIFGNARDRALYYYVQNLGCSHFWFIDKSLNIWH
jgi:hypothetical protein